MVVSLTTACHGEVGTLHNLKTIYSVNPDCQRSEKMPEGQDAESCPKLQQRSSRLTSILNWWGINVWIRTSCHNIQIKCCFGQLSCDPGQKFSHNSLLCQKATDTVAQLKSVKQDKCKLCQACTLHNPTKMTNAYVVLFVSLELHQNIICLKHLSLMIKVRKSNSHPISLSHSWTWWSARFFPEKNHDTPLFHL